MQSEQATQSDRATITGCHHLAICVHDIDEARRFYGEVLSLTELERPPEIAEKFRSAWYPAGRARSTMDRARPGQRPE